MYKKSVLKFLNLLLLLFLFNTLFPFNVTHAAISSPLNTISTAAEQKNVVQSLFDLILDKLLKPILNLESPTKNSSQNSETTHLRLDTSTIAKDNTLQNKIIIIDPGHGGNNPGAVQNNSREADNNLAVALKVQDKLTAAGATVIMTRSTDHAVAPEGSTLKQELQERVNLAEKNNADLFLSIHTNQNDDATISGMMTFYPSAQSPRLAQIMQESILKQTHSVDKGISPANFYVLRNTTMPSILIEMGFISNPQEASFLKSDVYRSKVADGIYNGVTNYFKS